MPAPLVDTHQHLIYPDTLTYPWIGEVPALQKPFTLEDYAELTAGAGIEAAVFMEVDVAESDSAKEANFFAEQAEREDVTLTGVIASARPENEGFEAYLDSIASPRLKGLRRVLHVVDDSVSQRPLFRANIKLLAGCNLPFDLCLLPPQHHLGHDLVDHCPEVSFVLDHCGNPAISQPDQFETWKQGMQKYAERPNVNAKLSGIVASVGHPNATLDEIRPYLDATTEAFGPDRLVWGSDWPVCTLTTTLPDWIKLFREWSSALSADEEAKICHLNAKRIYHL